MNAVAVAVGSSSTSHPLVNHSPSTKRILHGTTRRTLLLSSTSLLSCYFNPFSTTSSSAVAQPLQSGEDELQLEEDRVVNLFQVSLLSIWSLST